MDPEARRLEQRYGSDEALGVTRAHEDDPWVLPNGEEYGRCTNCARWVVDHEGGKVVGWTEGTNAGAALNQQMVGDGHDFALVGGRYLVDPWAKAYAGYTDRAAYDLQNPADRAEVARVYGDPNEWVEHRDRQWRPFSWLTPDAPTASRLLLNAPLPTASRFSLSLEQVRATQQAAADLAAAAQGTALFEG